MIFTIDYSNLSGKMNSESSSCAPANNWEEEEQLEAEESSQTRFIDPLVFHWWCFYNPRTPEALPEALGMDSRRWNWSEKEVLDHFVKQFTNGLKSGMRKRDQWVRGNGSKRTVCCFCWVWDELLARCFHKNELVRKSSTIIEFRLLCWQRVAEVFGRSILSETFPKQQMHVALTPIGYAVQDWQGPRVQYGAFHDPIAVQRGDIVGILGFQVESEWLVIWKADTSGTQRDGQFGFCAYGRVGIVPRGVIGPLHNFTVKMSRSSKKLTVSFACLAFDTDSSQTVWPSSCYCSSVTVTAAAIKA